MSKQKIVRVGNSLAITLPKKYVDQAMFKLGQSVAIEIDEKNNVLFVMPEKMIGQRTVYVDLYTWMAHVKEEYGDTIHALAKM